MEIQATPKGRWSILGVAKIHDNTYKLELHSEYGSISATFNVADLSPFDPKNEPNYDISLPDNNAHECAITYDDLLSTYSRTYEHPTNQESNMHAPSEHISSPGQPSSSEVPFSFFPSNESLASSHKTSIISVSTQKEPRTYAQAIKDPKWQEAIHKELQALESNKTWIITSLLHNKKAIGCKRVFKIKYRSDGNVERYKARLADSDDIILSGNNFHEINQLKTLLDTAFKIKDLGNRKFFLGLEIARNHSGISLNQRRYALEILSDTGMIGCKPTSTPMIQGSHLYQDDSGTYPNIPTYRRLAAIKILRYIKGSPALGLLFPRSSSVQLKAYNDNNWASCPDTRRSISGYCIYLGNALVS
ncbi:PREDICTED: uncharacterized protein LOC109330886 [Lupinus angustifolius]|uniref:uncharacterized protein LOC109330886 n=1 Tax=Lupinus angustifolius TaxID=3871 RepID=UPI00092F31AF|nr:PREDICTED: uncharacterized protein LOC109330886 [Lupinus angustifolius]